jgi:site-specific recombinase XerD
MSAPLRLKETLHLVFWNRVRQKGTKMISTRPEGEFTFTVWRRHTKNCKRRKRGRREIGCTCPLWGDGYLHNRRVLRKSLQTCDAVKANTRMVRLVEACVDALKEEMLGGEPDKAAAMPAAPAPNPLPVESEEEDLTVIANAAKAFLDNCVTNGLGQSTVRKYRNSLNHLVKFAEKKKIQMISDLKVIHLDKFRAERKLSPITAQKELEVLRQFCGYCADRDLCKDNVAKKIKSARNIEPNDDEPYTPEEVQRIIAATAEFGRNDYERRRALAMVLTIRFTAFRISDVAVLKRDRISMRDGRWVIFIRTTKNNKPVFLPVPRQMKEALDAVPVPRHAKHGCPYFFWNGTSKKRTAVGVVEECLAAVFKKSGVLGAHAQRFRHTLATELLGEGATFVEVADVLGNTPEVVRKHYAKWSKARQARVDDLMSRVHANADYRVDATQ